MIKHIFLRFAACLVCGFVLISCVYDYEEMEGCETEEPAFPFLDGYSINVKLTLDNMGGPDTRATSSDLRKFENYIDPEKCRVLFFDNQDRFLFESKSRWVKQLNATTGGEQWLVSVPMYAYGNDVQEKWRWQRIREVLMTEEDENGVSFKVAILANRPTIEVYPDLETEIKGEDNNNVRVATTFDNGGPHWGVEDTRFGGTLDSEGNNPNCKTIFNLHHTQEDPIYRDKGRPTQNSSAWTGDNFYDFIAETQTVTDATGQSKNVLAMSSTSSWVDFGVNNADDSPRSIWTDTKTQRRAARKADTSYPIPMYGVQNFGKIEKWIEGVPFNLSDFTGAADENNEYSYKNIALLRSVVKLELIIPKKVNNNDINVQFLALMYSNIYARCEPMDVWTPTNELWDKGLRHSDRDEDNDCEWFTVQKYARLVESGASTYPQLQGTLENNKGKVDNPTGNESTNNTYNFYAYRRRLSWFYGAWLEKKWPFEGVFQYNNGTGEKDSAYVRKIINERGVEPPHIFNPCIQRNMYVILDKENIYDFGDDNYHYVVYTGERNSIDPNVLYAIDNLDNTSPTVCYYLLAVNGTLYGIPITKYEGNNEARTQLNKTSTYVASNYAGGVPSHTPNMSDSKTENKPNLYPIKMVQASNSNPDLLPWALMRNHHYTIRVGSHTRAAGDGTFELDLSSDVNYSETLELK